MVLSVPFVCSANGDQKKISDPLELELQTATMWVLGAELESSGRATNILNCLSIFSAHLFLFYFKIPTLGFVEWETLKLQLLDSF